MKPFLSAWATTKRAMNRSYSALPSSYDMLTEDVPYESFVERYEKEFKTGTGEFALILDLCCGTGTVTSLLREKGYDVIGVDSSEEMLMEAKAKCPDVLFLCQDARELDLYGTVDACISSLDSLNYIPTEDLPGVFGRLRLFIRPGGLFLFDLRSEEFLRGIDGFTSVDETDDTLCLWRADFDEAEGCLCYGLDLFTKKGSLWKRHSEEHIEFCHSVSAISAALNAAGFEILNLSEEDGRIFISSERK